jgi:hypothetical protein
MYAQEYPYWNQKVEEALRHFSFRRLAKLLSIDETHMKNEARALLVSVMHKVHAGHHEPLVEQVSGRPFRGGLRAYYKNDCLILEYRMEQVRAYFDLGYSKKIRDEKP